MPTLLIVRHAKSDWSDPTLADHDRPLARRGCKALPRMREHLAESVGPDVVLCSTARRAVDTLEGIRPAFPDDADVRFEEELYGAGSSLLIRRLRTVGRDVDVAMLVGHNPGLEDLAMLLVDDGDPELVARLTAKFPTGAIATLSFDRRWADLAPGDARLDGYFTPREPR